MPQSTAANVPEFSLDDYRWLIGEDAAPWLESAAASAQRLTSQVARLRTHLSRERTHLVLELAALRHKARAKFAAADRMFFTARALEQSTDEVVAAYKARRFAKRARIFDLCSGIGGDLLALAAVGETLGVDHDPLMALLAEANARALGAGEPSMAAARRVEVRVCDVGQIDAGECAAWHIDPDRRPRGRRTTLVDLHQPGPETIERLLSRNRDGAVKLAPAASLSQAWADAAELEWISRGGECRQLVAWFGGLARDGGQRRATVLSAKAPPRTLIGASAVTTPVARQIGRYVFEPDAAVLAAKLDGALAAEHALEAVAPGIAYWTGGRVVADAALDSFEVREVLPLRVKPLAALLRSRQIGRLEIKKRGVAIDPAQLRRQLNPQGPESAVLLVTRIGKQVTAIVATRASTA